MKIKGTRALVTGGSRGIGLGYAQALAAEGCSVVLIHFQDTERAAHECAQLAASYPNAKFAECEADVGNPAKAREAVRCAAEFLGGLDIAVSNAGICKFAPFLELTDDDWARHVATNFSGGFYVGHEAARLMVAQKTGGRIVYTTSIGAFRSNGTQTHYCATKGGLSLLAQGMALELAPHGITVNCIAPGWIHTDINDGASRDLSAVQPWIKAHCPVGRLGSPEDMQSALVFLCAGESSYVTGSTISVDGGWNAQL